MNRKTKLAGIATFLIIVGIVAYSISYSVNFRNREMEALGSETGLNVKKLESLARKLLPEGTEFINMGDNSRTRHILQGDMDGDGINEIVAVYRNKKKPQNGVCIIKYENGEWKRISEHTGLDGIIDWTSLNDLTGEGCMELLIGHGSGESIGFELDIMEWQGNTVVNTANIDYHTLYVEDMPGEDGKDGIAEIAIGHKDGSFDVLRLWNFGQFIPAEDVCLYFFTKELARLEKCLKGDRDVSDLYLLAEALYYLTRYDECIQIISEAISSKNIDNDLRRRFLLLKAKAHLKKGELINSERHLRELIEEQVGAKTDFHAECLLELGNCLGAAGEYNGAREAYKISYDMFGEIYESNDFAKLARQLMVREAASRFETEMVQDMLEKWLFDKKQSHLSELKSGIIAWGEDKNLSVNTVLPEKSTIDGEYMLLDMETAVPDRNIVGTVKGFAFLWRFGENIDSQIIYTGNKENYINKVVTFRIVKGAGEFPEAGIVLNGSGGNYDCPVFRLFRHENGTWKKVWSSPEAGWRNIDGSITFIGNGISEFIIKSSSFCHRDAKSRIFLESRGGPHRWFMDTWIRQGDGYILKTAQTIPSAYSTLVEFIYNLSVGKDRTAATLVADERQVGKAKKLGLAQKPLGQEWTIEVGNDANDVTGPLTVVISPQSMRIPGKVEISFVNRDGSYLISAILPL